MAEVGKIFQLARIFHTDRDEEVAKADGARQNRILTQSCMSTYCSSHNSILTQHLSAFPASAVDWYEISGLSFNNLLAHSYVTAQEYASFLTSSATSDEHHLYEARDISILRYGKPGEYSYQAIQKDEIVDCVDAFSAMRYANWKSASQQLAQKMEDGRWKIEVEEKTEYGIYGLERDHLIIILEQAPYFVFMSNGENENCFTNISSIKLTSSFLEHQHEVSDLLLKSNNVHFALLDNNSLQASSGLPVVIDLGLEAEAVEIAEVVGAIGVAAVGMGGANNNHEAPVAHDANLHHGGELPVNHHPLHQAANEGEINNENNLHLLAPPMGEQQPVVIATELPERNIIVQNVGHVIALPTQDYLNDLLQRTMIQRIPFHNHDELWDHVYGLAVADGHPQEGVNVVRAERQVNTLERAVATSRRTLSDFPNAHGIREELNIHETRLLAAQRALAEIQSIWYASANYIEHAEGIPFNDSDDQGDPPFQEN